MTRWWLGVLAVAGCTGDSEPPRAWPLLQTFGFTDPGIVTDDACRNASWLSAWSFRDLSKTAVRDDVAHDTCIVPVDDEHEQFVLQAISCRRVDGDPNRVDIDFTAHSGRAVGTITLTFAGTSGNSTGQPAALASREFGAGLVLDSDLTAYSYGGQGSCQVIGYYLDRGAPALGSVRIADGPRRSQR